MSASQYLRPESLVDNVRNHLTPDVVRNASSLVGESESSTFHALHGGVASLLGGFLSHSSTPDGGNTLSGMFRDGGFASTLTNPASLFGGGGQTSNMMSTGQSLVSRVFGNRASSVSDAIASSSGVKPSSASTLMALLAPLTLGVVGKTAGSQGTSITNLLQGQKREIAAAAPSGVSNILGFSGATGPVAAPAPTALYEERERVSSGQRWLPLLLIGLLALGLLAYLLSRGRGAAVNTVPAPVPTAPVSNVPLPHGGNLSVPQGSINDNLAHFLASGSQELPKTFVFDRLNFQTGSAQLTPDSAPTVNNLESILRAYPNAQIQLAGFTDNTGSAQANQQLSLDRANSVKAMLVSAGIAANRVATVGYGQDRPIASNDTEDGRARNRRTELTVTAK